MPLYRVSDQKLEQVAETTFASEKILERRDLQKLLISNLSPLGDDLFLLAEEYGDWEESARRIDLLCLDKQRNLVVIEIKRTEDGGHMELQALRYAAMVSSMTLEEAIATHQRHLTKTGSSVSAQSTILDFLNEDSISEIELTGDVRIVLASANFSTEITTSVLWLNKRNLDITCIRLTPYSVEGKILIDAAQIIPLPEAAEYEIKIRTQIQETRKAQTARADALLRFWAQFIDYSKGKTPLFAGRSTTKDQWMSVGFGINGFTMGVSLTENRARAECFIRDDRDKDRDRAKKWSKAAYAALEKQRDAIQSAFDAEDKDQKLSWHLLPEGIGCRICYDFDCNWRSDESAWQEIQERLTTTVMRLYGALKPRIDKLNVQA